MDDLFESTTPLPAPPEPKAEAHPEGEMPFFPDFALREALVALVFLCVLLLVASITKPGLEPGADPAAAGYVPKPEWYFLWLFQTLKYFEGEPGRTAVNMQVATIARLAEIPNIVGVKEASGSMKQITDIIARCGSDFDVVSGEDFLTYPLMCVGSKGVISVTSNILPADMAKLCNLCLEGNFAEAQKLDYRLLPVCHALFYETNPAPVKAALAMMGKIASDEVRLPLVGMSQANRDKLRRDLQDYGIPLQN